ncbi:DUF1853 family protein [Christiangramia echinicola]|uniref:DUF1853 family protein n=1 Tax=Christiangramia echinicola TaxID=279359 RepID=UPI00040654B8|nr:DUF1853 family protein [Christiangramia echinicola]
MKEISILEQFLGFLKTPDIFPESKDSEFKTFDFPEVNITDSLAASLDDLHHPRNSVLGKRMESFFEIAIDHSSRYELLASNIQIIENKQTLGELDFLLFDNEEAKPLHVELVYKLYVYDPEFPSELERWIGPNRKDSFSEKLEKLRTKQFPLLFKNETSSYLDKLGVDPQNIEQQLCFKAQLFTPLDLILKDANILNPEAYTGNWYSLKEFLNKDWKNNLFYSPKKKNWNCEPGKNKNWISHSTLLLEIEDLFQNNKAPLVWMKTEKSYHRFFIVWW